MNKEHDPSRCVEENALELAIGTQVKQFRIKQGMTVADLAREAQLSPGMLSKVENGMTSPSLATLNSLSKALNVPVTSLFRLYEEISQATFVPAGGGLDIERQGTRAGHQYKLLGHSSNQQPAVEPYIVTLSEKSDVFPLFQHPGIEFIHVLEGEVIYRHANNIYPLKPGDSLYFDSEALHGPEELVSLPIRLLTVIVGRHGINDD
ncbi:MAG: helix-turn-helix domain-containing protein [Gammaproteobacteria bacterium]|nr:helix-turn-helix domain-containing protein [Gammaproteobacteria bacterium]